MSNFSPDRQGRGGFLGMLVYLFSSEHTPLELFVGFVVFLAINVFSFFFLLFGSFTFIRNAFQRPILLIPSELRRKITTYEELGEARLNLETQHKRGKDMNETFAAQEERNDQRYPVVYHHLAGMRTSNAGEDTVLTSALQAPPFVCKSSCTFRKCASLSVSK